jgi:uncharacterized Ntn-hydrolase superfamily protein
LPGKRAVWYCAQLLQHCRRRPLSLATGRGGAVSSQNITLPALGQLALAQLEQGFAPDIALRRALAEDDFSRYRQIIAIDANGQTAAFSGDKTLGIYHVAEGETALPLEICWPARRLLRRWWTGFQQSEGEMALRLLAALQAGLACGGEAGPVHSAAVKVVDDYSWPLVDLRIDWSEDDPIGELAALWQAYEPQMQAYITRARPAGGPSYGVPGDE